MIYEEEDDEDEEEEEEDDNDEDYEDDDDDEESLYAFINDFPIQMICLEKCDGTFDELLVNKELSEKECESAAFQIVMVLAIFQKLFKFTHNDLHTNNIVYNNTKVKYLYYKFEGKTYQVPTHGKIYKLIDFGRSIYTVNGKLFCSDSFSKNGDASTQYNFSALCSGDYPETIFLEQSVESKFAPYYNKKKPTIEPNDSFDLCRLGCSIFDFVFEEIPEEGSPVRGVKKTKKMSKFQKLINDWCTDDHGKNILYKRNGDERYPQFKLYKMIARTVHNCVPKEELLKPIFQQFIYHPSGSNGLSKGKKNKKQSSLANVEEISCEQMDIDEIPNLY
jgi:hypothetical protein